MGYKGWLTKRKARQMNAILEMKDVINTYRGKVGCACGCGGTYAEANTKASKSRLDFINKNLGDPKMQIDFFSDGEICYEFENKDGTRVTRVYVQYK
jgi:hypothetical protein